MPVRVGLNVWSRLVESLFPYLDQTAGPFESLWFPDHVQYGANKVAEGWTLLAYALARYPDKVRRGVRPGTTVRDGSTPPGLHVACARRARCIERSTAVRRVLLSGSLEIQS